HPGRGRQSSSVNATIGAAAARHPAFRALAAPGRSQRTTYAPASAPTLAVPSERDAESTTINSSSGAIAARAASSACSSNAGRSLLGTTTAIGRRPVRSVRMRVLLVSSWPPWPLTDGACLVLHHHLRLLAPHH